MHVECLSDDESTLTQITPVAGQEQGFRVRVGEGVSGWIAQNKQSVLIANTLLDERVSHIAGTPLREESMVGAPLIYEGRVRGVITLSKLGGSSSTRTPCACWRSLPPKPPSPSIVLGSTPNSAPKPSPIPSPGSTIAATCSIGSPRSGVVPGATGTASWPSCSISIASKP